MVLEAIHVGLPEEGAVGKADKGEENEAVEMHDGQVRSSL